MALFGKPDFDIPYLTQFVQCDLYDTLDQPVSELQDSEEPLKLLMMRGRELYQFITGQYRRGVVGGLTNPDDFPWDYATELFGGKEIVREVPQFHYDVIQLMTATADNTSVKGIVLERINAFINQLVRLDIKVIARSINEDNFVSFSRLTGNDTAFRALDVPARDVRVIDNQIGSDITLRRLVAELRDIFGVDSSDKLARLIVRCPECNYPYVKPSERQIYCSSRCNSRAKVRRFRSTHSPKEQVPVDSVTS